MAMDNFDDPQSQFLMQMGLGLLGAQTPSFAQALSQGGMMGLAGYQQAQDRNSKREMQAMAMQEAVMALAARKRQEEYQRQVDELARSSMRHGQAPSQTFAPGDYETPSQVNPGSPGGFDYGAFIAGLPGLGAQGVDKALSMQQMLAKDNPFEKVSAKDFTPASIAKFAQTRNHADLVPVRKTEVMNLGGKSVTWDPYNTAPNQSLTHSLTPSEAWTQMKDRAGEVREVTLPDGTTQLARVGLDNKVTPVMGTGQKREKLHDAAAEKLLQLDQMIGTSDMVQKEIDLHGGVGPVMGRIPTVMANYIDPKGIKARQFLADLTTQITLARSGAAVTEQEYKRLAPFLAETSDTPAIAKTKLKNLSSVYGEIRANKAKFYEGQGYRVPGQMPGQGAPNAGGGRIGSVANGDAPRIVDFRDLSPGGG